MQPNELLESVELLKQIKPLFDRGSANWIPALAAILGAFVGGISTFFPTYILQRRKERFESRSVTVALVAEISAILSVVEARTYIESVEEIVRSLHSSPDQKQPYSVTIPEHYSRVFQSNTCNLGIVDSALLPKIIQFHQLIDAAVQDIKPNSTLAAGNGDVMRFEELLSIMKRARTLGEEIVRSNA